MSDHLEKHTNTQDGVPVVVVPFEEWHSVDSSRLERCSAGFVYLDPDSGQVGTIPFCMWCLYRKDMFRRISEKYAAEVEAATAE